MKGLYNFSLTLATVFLKGLSNFSPKINKLVTGRKMSFQSLADFIGKDSRKRIWFHVASLGEYEQAKPVIHELKKVFPEKAVALTFFSPSGFENVIKKPQPNVDFIAYLPFDTARNAEQWVEVLDPEMVFFVKYDLWANYIFSINKRNIPLFLFSASMRPDQIYFKSYGGFFRKILYCFDYIFTQNPETVELLKKIHYDRTTVTGDTRYDNVDAISKNPKKFTAIETFVQSMPVIVVGSAWEEDMALIIPFLNSDAAVDYIFIIAPHDIEEEKIKEWQHRIRIPSVKYSNLNDGANREERVLFIDNVGMLSSLYQYAKLAYVGGAFGKGLHNILEPLSFGIPVLFGEVKKKGRFPEAAISKDYGCGFVVKTAEEFLQMIKKMEEEEYYQKACQVAQKLVHDNLGSAKKIVKQVQQIVK